MFRAAKFHHGGFPKPGATRAHSRYLHRYAHAAGLRKETRQLLRAILFVPADRYF